MIIAARALIAQCPDGTPPPCSRAAGPRANANSVAVLYFDNLSRDTNYTYLADGLTEEVIATLGKVRRLDVKSLYASQQFRGRATASPAAVGHALGAAFLLRGSVRPTAGTVRVTYELLRASTGAHVAGDLLDRSSVELAGVPGDLADAVASAILGSLRPEERASLVRRPTESAEAHDSYLRALHAADSWSQQGPQVAIEYLDRAIALDSSFAPAYAAKGEALALLADAYLVGRDAYTQARAAAARAVQLDSSLALGYAVLSISAMALEYDIPASADLAHRAIRLDPRVGMGHIMLGTDLLIGGHDREAMVELRRGWEADTLDAVGTAIYIWSLYLTHQPDSMAAALPRAAALAPEDIRAYRGLLDYGRGDYSAAVRRLSWSYYGGWLAGEYVHSLVRLERRDEARAVVDSMIASRSRGYYNPYAIGRGYVALGDLDSAFTWLERGYQERTQWMVFMFFDPMFAPLKNDPRYVAIISRMRS